MSNLFENLQQLGEGLSRDAATLQQIPGAEKALEAWADDFDFSGVFGTRWKDISDETLAYAMVMNTCSFGVLKDCGYPKLDGLLYNESMYSTYVWLDGEWVNWDDLTEEQMGPEKLDVETV